MYGITGSPSTYHARARARARRTRALDATLIAAATAAAASASRSERCHADGRRRRCFIIIFYIPLPAADEPVRAAAISSTPTIYRTTTPVIVGNHYRLTEPIRCFFFFCGVLLYSVFFSHIHTHTHRRLYMYK